MSLNLSIKPVSYNNTDDLRILKACLEKWFSNPKDLNYTAPHMSYPFNFQKWVVFYKNLENIKTYILQKDGWIIGYVSLQFRPGKNRVHLFHLFVDRNYRGQGHGKQLIDHVESVAVKADINRISLRVLPQNRSAIRLYESLGYQLTGTAKNKNLNMEKRLNRI